MTDDEQIAAIRKMYVQGVPIERIADGNVVPVVSSMIQAMHASNLYDLYTNKRLLDEITTCRELEKTVSQLKSKILRLRKQLTAARKKRTPPKEK